jgi:protein-S-isoprenylcysteine O-methyltransferase Ste14
MGSFRNPKDGVVRSVIEFLVRLALLASICLVFWWASIASLSNITNLSVLAGGPLVVFLVAWLGRKILDRRRAAVHWITMFVHFAVGLLVGVPIVRAFVTHQGWPDRLLPIAPEIGNVLVIVTGAACFLTVANLALRGLGAPAIVLSRKLAVDWLYAWTRNPMVLAALAWLLSLGIWFRSMLFVLWVFILLTPALLFFVKVYEERELEIRFGPSYLEYRSRTPMLLPRRPKT